MKQTILSAIAITGLATCAFGQGVILDNAGNAGAVSATTGGLLYIQVGASTTLFDGFNYNIGATVLAGSSAGSLSLIGTFTPATDSKGYTGFDVGKFSLGAAAATTTIAGLSPGQTAVIELQLWDYDYNTGGPYSSYAAAVLGGGYTAQVTFNNPTGGPLTSPPSAPPELTGMPSVVLSSVPEPTTFAIAGLGIASLLAIRRRK